MWCVRRSATEGVQRRARMKIVAKKSLVTSPLGHPWPPIRRNSASDRRPRAQLAEICRFPHSNKAELMVIRSCGAKTCVLATAHMRGVQAGTPRRPPVFMCRAPLDVR